MIPDELTALVRPSRYPRYDAPPTIDGDVLILSDLQIPFHDARWIARCLCVARAWRVNRLLLNGDIVDLAAFSIFVNAGTPDSEQELDECERTIAGVIDGFERVLWIKGNHENRLSNRVGTNITTRRVGKLIGVDDAIETSEYYFALVGDDWLIEHPKNSSIIPARVAAQLAAKFHRNVITGHGHTHGTAQDVSGKYISIDAGVCCDPERMSYAALRHSTRPAMTRGAVILRVGDDGKHHPIVLNEQTDFDWLVKMGELWQEDRRKQAEQAEQECLSAMR